MSVTIQVTNYSDFKTVVNDLSTLGSGRVYYHLYGSGTPTSFQAVYVSDDSSRMVFMAPSTNSTTPSGFSTDFPAAILLTNASLWALPLMGTSSWQFFSG